MSVSGKRLGDGNDADVVIEWDSSVQDILPSNHSDYEGKSSHLSNEIASTQRNNTHSYKSRQKNSNKSSYVPIRSPCKGSSEVFKPRQRHSSGSTVPRLRPGNNRTQKAAKRLQKEKNKSQLSKEGLLQRMQKVHQLDSRRRMKASQQAKARCRAEMVMVKNGKDPTQLASFSTAAVRRLFRGRDREREQYLRSVASRSSGSAVRLARSSSLSGLPPVPRLSKVVVMRDRKEEAYRACHVSTVDGRENTAGDIMRVLTDVTDDGVELPSPGVNIRIRQIPVKFVSTSSELGMESTCITPCEEQSDRESISSPSNIAVGGNEKRTSAVANSEQRDYHALESRRKKRKEAARKYLKQRRRRMVEEVKRKREYACKQKECRKARLESLEIKCREIIQSTNKSKGNSPEVDASPVRSLSVLRKSNTHPCREFRISSGDAVAASVVRGAPEQRIRNNKVKRKGVVGIHNSRFRTHAQSQDQIKDVFSADPGCSPIEVKAWEQWNITETEGTHVKSLSSECKGDEKPRSKVTTSLTLDATEDPYSVTDSNMESVTITRMGKQASRDKKFRPCGNGVDRETVRKMSSSCDDIIDAEEVSANGNMGELRQIRPEIMAKEVVRSVDPVVDNVDELARIRTSIKSRLFAILDVDPEGPLSSPSVSMGRNRSCSSVENSRYEYDSDISEQSVECWKIMKPAVSSDETVEDNVLRSASSDDSIKCRLAQFAIKQGKEELLVVERQVPRARQRVPSPPKTTLGTRIPSTGSGNIDKESGIRPRQKDQNLAESTNQVQKNTREDESLEMMINNFSFHSRSPGYENNVGDVKNFLYDCQQEESGEKCTDCSYSVGVNGSESGFQLSNSDNDEQVDIIAAYLIEIDNRVRSEEKSLSMRLEIERWRIEHELALLKQRLNARDSRYISAAQYREEVRRLEIEYKDVYEEIEQEKQRVCAHAYEERRKYNQLRKELTLCSSDSIKSESVMNATVDTLQANELSDSSAGVSNGYLGLDEYFSNEEYLRRSEARQEESKLLGSTSHGNETTERREKFRQLEEEEKEVNRIVEDWMNFEVNPELSGSQKKSQPEATETMQNISGESIAHSPYDSSVVVGMCDEIVTGKSGQLSSIHDSLVKGEASRTECIALDEMEICERKEDKEWSEERKLEKDHLLRPELKTVEVKDNEISIDRSDGDVRKGKYAVSQERLVCEERCGVSTNSTAFGKTSTVIPEADNNVDLRDSNLHSKYCASAQPPQGVSRKSRVLGSVDRMKTDRADCIVRSVGSDLARKGLNQYDDIDIVEEYVKGKTGSEKVHLANEVTTALFQRFINDVGVKCVADVQKQLHPNEREPVRLSACCISQFARGSSDNNCSCFPDSKHVEMEANHGNTAANRENITDDIAIE